VLLKTPPYVQIVAAAELLIQVPLKKPQSKVPDRLNIACDVVDDAMDIEEAGVPVIVKVLVTSYVVPAVRVMVVPTVVHVILAAENPKLPENVVDALIVNVPPIVNVLPAIVAVEALETVTALGQALPLLVHVPEALNVSPLAPPIVIELLRVKLPEIVIPKVIIRVPV
jgi:hypothetical protein